MFEKLIRKVWNRRSPSLRLPLNVSVKTQDPEGNMHEVVSEDISDSGVRLRFEKVGLTKVMGHREEVPLQLCLEEDEKPIETLGQLVWAYNTAHGGSISGWRFVNFDSSSARRLQKFLNAQEG
ncbi:MAG: PilZ domain-containing protein [bacterium]|nr:PilZ domain-containing protein [bacterium]